MNLHELDVLPQSEATGYWRLCKIGPEHAERLLESMVRNRNVTASRIASYAESISAGQWLVTHQGIAIHNGRLVDGQTRCHAIIRSGVAVSVWVYFSHGVDYMREIDRQQARRDSQVATICGLDASAQDVAVGTIVFLGRAFATRSTITQTHELLERVKAVEPVVAWLRSVGFSTKRKGLTQAAIVGAIGRGAVVYGNQRMARFASIYLDGASFERHESAAARLRDVAMQGIRSRGTGDRLDTYLKAAAAIKAFVESRPLTKLYATDMPEEPLPIDWNT